MSKLQISLEQMLDVPLAQLDEPRVGVIANVYPVGESAKLDVDRRRALRDLVVPFEAGANARGLELDVEPGEYLVEATLPSGQLVSSEVKVKPGEVRPVLLQAPESPHEWLSWQHLQGRLPASRRSYDSRRKALAFAKPAPQGAPPSMRSMDAVSIEAGAAADAANGEEVRVRVLAVLVGEAPADSWRGMMPAPEQLDTTLSRGNKAHMRAVEIVRRQRSHAAAELNALDEATQHFLFRSESRSVKESLAGLQSMIPGDWHRYVRLFCEIQHREVSHVIALPVPWRSMTGVEAPIDIAATFAAPAPMRDSPRGLQTLVAVRDARFATLLGYLGKGNMSAASSIVGIAKEYLMGKMANPFAAAAGAYVLLETLEGASERRNEWTSWIRNLMNYFEHIPDGAVLQAWVSLKSHGTDAELAKARASLLEAFSRGIPYYSVGVRLLVDGLTLFANDAREDGSPDKDVESALEISRWFAMRTDMKQALTVLRLPRGA